MDVVKNNYIDMKILYERINKINDLYIKKRYSHLKTDTINFGLSRFIRFKINQQMSSTKRQLLYNKRRNINNDINDIIDNITRNLNIDNNNKKRNFIKQKKRKLNKNKPKKTNERLGSLHTYHTRPKYIPDNRVLSIYDIYLIKIQKIYRGYYCRKIVNEHLNVIIKRHIQLIDSEYYKYPFNIKLKFCNLISCSNKKFKFEEWVMNLFKVLYPNFQYEFIKEKNNIFNIKVSLNNIIQGFIYCKNNKGTITVSNTEIKKMKTFLEKHNLTYDNIYITTTSRITDISIMKFKEIGFNPVNILSMNNILLFIQRSIKK
jgi:hypothetical protein